MRVPSQVLYFWSDVGSHRCYGAIAGLCGSSGCHASDYRPLPQTNTVPHHHPHPRIQSRIGKKVLLSVGSGYTYYTPAQHLVNTAAQTYSKNRHRIPEYQEYQEYHGP